MNVLDENIVVSQRELLRSWKIHFRRIGGEVGRLGMGDRDEIIPLLHSLARPTFFTQDHGFYHPRILHPGYCLVHLDVVFDEVAEYTRRFPRHREFRTHTQRLGKIARVRPSGVSYWEVHRRGEHALSW
ncbi:MAG: hypothetical protein HOP18_28105 [Deltaproteobacteria bacterium]|nr:hypothetical protein [Deltaproteobacteria bacterium]